MCEYMYASIVCVYMCVCMHRGGYVYVSICMYVCTRVHAYIEVDGGVGVGVGMCECWSGGHRPRRGVREAQCGPSLETLEDIPLPLGLGLGLGLAHSLWGSSHSPRVLLWKSRCSLPAPCRK